MFATAIKAHGTGMGGSFSQRAVRALRDTDLKAVLELTHPVTQSILQAKHDAAEARHKYEMLQGPGRELWRGRKMEHVGPGRWETEMVDGEPVQATTEQWQEQFVDFYRSRDGFGVDVNPEYVSRVAAALTDPRTGTVRNLEEDPQLAGSLMDRMAYGGEFSDLVKAARDRRSIFEGERSSQFAAAGARRAIETSQALLEADLDQPAAVQRVADDAVRRDVIADTEARAQVRDQARRSEHAMPVAVTTSTGPVGAAQSDDVEMGL